MTETPELTNLDRLIWVDIETFGLDPERDPILEVGFRITDLDLETIDDIQLCIWDSPSYDRKFDELDREGWVYKTHVKSGLWTTARHEGYSVEVAETQLLHFLRGHGVGTFTSPDDKEPMCGSSVHFDRAHIAAQLPDVAALFSYRNIDVSTVKELCRRYNPRVFGALDSSTRPKKLHRALPDLDDTIAEAEFYKDNFLFI